jgi:hypothetical protein
MWEIIYTFNNHFRDRDNYPTMSTGEPCFVTGETVDGAFQNLIKELEDYGRLKSLIDAAAIDYNSNDYYALEIVSFKEVANERDIDFEDHPIVKEMIKKRRKEISDKEKTKKRRDETAKKKADLKKLAELKAKYEK